MIQYGIVILAAGNSSRLGKTKQLLTYQHKSLIKHVVDEALNLSDTYSVIVTGAEKTAVEEELKDTAAIICYNAEWQQGMSSSIKRGIQKILRLQPQVKACILCVCDQPFITASILNRLIIQYAKTGCGIIASSYAGTSGTPVLFSRDYFDELLKLTGQEGAKKLLKVHEAEVMLLPFDKGEIDIDTNDDYNQLMAMKL